MEMLFRSKQLENAYKSLKTNLGFDSPLKEADEMTKKRVERLRLLENRKEPLPSVEEMEQLMQEAQWDSQFRLRSHWADKEF